LPREKLTRFVNLLQVPTQYAEIIINDPSRSSYFEKVVELAKNKSISTKMIADMIVNRNFDKKFEDPHELVKKLIEIFSKEFATNEEVKNACEKVIKENEKAIRDYNQGKGEVIGFLIGQVQKFLKGRGRNDSVRKELLKGIQKI